ncbi:MAG: hypothetical protein GF334_07180 [Candidatus Altiarchaeales archaeon]|nr:hypothetical protein [Candidatus Altiarchaeales archaeon]
MAMRKFGNAAVVTPVVSPGKWIDKKVPAGRVKTAKDVLAKYDPGQWLLSHVTIIASVDVDQADPDDPKSNYLIKPEHSIFVNNNGDSWERGLLKNAYKTFLGADNYVEHVQIPELSKGKVIDVALREVPFTKDANGNDITTLYVDILIATNRQHGDLVRKIEAGEYNATSMGCLIKYSQCSQCGNIAEDEADACKHVRYFKKNFFYDRDGNKRIIAELCGRAEDPDSCRFIDASWVRKPAFEGAVLRNIIEPGVDVSDKIQRAINIPSFKAEPGMLLRAASEAATEVVNEVESQDEPAPSPAPKDDSGFPEAPADTGKPLDVDTPPPEGGDTPAPESGGESGGEGAPSSGGGDAPAPDSAPPGGAAGAPGGAAPGSSPEPQIQEPPEDATIKEVKDMVVKQVLNEMRRGLLKQEARTQQEDRPAVNENEVNESLIKDASYKKLVSESRRIRDDRLENGLMILSNLKDWKRFKKYGYNRDDVLGILYFMDRTIGAEPVGEDSVKALSHVKLASDNLKKFFTEIILETGRKPGKYEATKLASWARILRYFE